MNQEVRRYIDFVGFLNGGVSFDTPDVSDAKDSVSGFNTVYPDVVGGSLPSFRFTKHTYGYVNEHMIILDQRYSELRDIKDIVKSLKMYAGVTAKQVAHYILLTKNDIELNKTYKFVLSDDETGRQVIWFRDINAKRHDSMFKPAPRARKTFMVEAGARRDTTGTVNYRNVNARFHVEGLKRSDYLFHKEISIEDKEKIMEGHLTDDELLCLYGADRLISPWHRRDNPVQLSDLLNEWSNRFLESEFTV